jgi:hypothetical protein
LAVAVQNYTGRNNLITRFLIKITGSFYKWIFAFHSYKNLQLLFSSGRELFLAIGIKIASTKITKAWANPLHFPSYNYISTKNMVALSA